MAADGRVYGRFTYFPVPRRVAERFYMANETVPAAFGVADTDEQLLIRTSTA